MKANLELFHPKLRPGRVIPQGARIIFETEDPYNQIVLPMVLADFILLCSGKFSVREIIDKMYRKQGSVPFKSILKAIHLLHQGGFFENGDELVLNSHLRSWTEPARSRRYLSWTFVSRIESDRHSTVTFYCLTLLVLIASLFGLQRLPWSPFEILMNTFRMQRPLLVVFQFAAALSLLQTGRYLLRGVQILFLTGKVYNVSLRLSGWGLYLHIGDEANDLFDHRLYTAMFHVSQILFGWFFVLCASPFVNESWLRVLSLSSLALTYWEANPFVPSEGLKLIRSLLAPEDDELASWHFENSSVVRNLSPIAFRKEEEFVRACSIWGLIWLAVSILALANSALLIGPALLEHLDSSERHLLWSVAGVGLWLFALYAIAKAFVEKVVVSMLRPGWQRLNHWVQSARSKNRTDYSIEELKQKTRDLPLLSHFGEVELEKVIEASKVITFKKGGVIIFQGDEARDLFVLLEGEVEIIRHSGSREEWISELGAISIFGESALLDETPRAAKVVAKSSAKVVKIPVQSIRRLAQDTHSVRHLDDFRNAILVNQFFASSPVFRSLSGEAIEFLCSRGALEYFDREQSVFEQGDSGDSIYFLLRGAVEIFVHNRFVKRLSQGSFFGEIALIANIPRTASVVTTEPSVVFRITSDSFWEILVQNIDLGVFIETISETRLIEDLNLAPAADKKKLTGTDS